MRNLKTGKRFTLQSHFHKKKVFQHDFDRVVLFQTTF